MSLIALGVAAGLVAAGCAAKYVAQSWASSKLEEEEAHTQSLLRKLDYAKAAANERVQAKRNDYSRKIKAHQEKRNEQLKAYIHFMNEQLQITAGYLPELNQFQAFMFTCVDSWMHVDLCQQEIDIVYQKIRAIVRTIGLIDAYISELNKLSQRQGRHAWRELIAARRLTVTNDYVDKTKDRIDRTSKSNHDEFKNELKRLQSHRSALYNDINSLRNERFNLLQKKKMLDQRHIANKKALKEKYESCVGHWCQIAKKFEAYYAFEVSELKYVNEWMADLNEGGTLLEIIQVIGTANELVKSATEKFHNLNNEYQPYKRRVKAAHDSKEYPDTFANDNAQRKRLAPMVTAAFEDKKALIDARSFLCTRRDELRGYIDRIKPLHPDAAIDAICEMLSADREFDAWLAFGINTSKQKREHWEKKQCRIENAAKN
ncbi:hypothetical protein EBQ25_02125 [Allofranklinella schreckenbergeri]|uniref:Uncharacterized protein n=1 Tax=Allofranklinella schreckenbergeri TaxID=1076744 RepID=A0A3M6QHV2_9BURK|nr:hypothetical protein [Allofranklinella schreckenbergeri]RMX02049.1 hypothetical protein EBQ25_02125 [Allofranklinella schreckenbergeri]